MKKISVIISFILFMSLVLLVSPRVQAQLPMPFSSVNYFIPPAPGTTSTTTSLMPTVPIWTMPTWLGIPYMPTTPFFMAVTNPVPPLPGSTSGIPGSGIMPFTPPALSTGYGWTGLPAFSFGIMPFTPTYTPTFSSFAMPYTATYPTFAMPFTPSLVPPVMPLFGALTSFSPIMTFVPPLPTIAPILTPTIIAPTIALPTLIAPPVPTVILAPILPTVVVAPPAPTTSILLTGTSAVVL